MNGLCKTLQDDMLLDTFKSILRAFFSHFFYYFPFFPSFFPPFYFFFRFSFDCYFFLICFSLLSFCFFPLFFSSSYFLSDFLSCPSSISFPSPFSSFQSFHFSVSITSFPTFSCSSFFLLLPSSLLFGQRTR